MNQTDWTMEKGEMKIGKEKWRDKNKKKGHDMSCPLHRKQKDRA